MASKTTGHFYFMFYLEKFLSRLINVFYIRFFLPYFSHFFRNKTFYLCQTKTVE